VTAIPAQSAMIQDAAWTGLAPTARAASRLSATEPANPTRDAVTPAEITEARSDTVQAARLPDSSDVPFAIKASFNLLAVPYL